tara:strand:+ start:64 stop:714 length:651 start_codon:yes stop_codon:yes gene_type:complete
MKSEDLKQMVDECMDNAYQDKQGKTHLPTFCMVKKLRNKFGDTYAIVTDPVPEFCTDRLVTASSKILKDGKLISSGMASCNRIEKDAIEIAETKAVGRALSFFGMLVDSVAPKESMEHYEKSMGVKGSYTFKPAPTSNDDPLDDPLPTTSKNGVVNVESIKEKLLKAPTLSKLNDLWNRVHRQEIDTLIKNSKAMYGEVYNTFNHRRAEIKRQGDI